MSTIAMPTPDAGTLDRRDEIVEALEAAVPGAVIADPAETRAYECDALTAYRCPPLAVVLPYTTEIMEDYMSVLTLYDEDELDNLPGDEGGARSSLWRGNKGAWDSGKLAAE